VGPIAAPLDAGQTAASLDPSSYRLDNSLLRRFTLDIGAAITAPARWSGGDWAGFGWASAATLAILAWDDGLYTFVQDRKTPLSRDAFPLITQAGHGGYVAAALGLLYLGGEAFDSASLRRTAFLGLESFAASGLIVLAIKTVVGRARPYADEGPYSFHPFSFTGRNASFVSGHSASAFAVAAVIAEASRSVLVDVLSYGLAGLVAVSRVHESKHWPSDVVAGSLLGLFVGWKIADLDRAPGGRSARLEWTAPAGFPGLGLSLRF
jgi:membrane-associated phospholipid phosphatase